MRALKLLPASNKIYFEFATAIDRCACDLFRNHCLLFVLEHRNTLIVVEVKSENKNIAKMMSTETIDSGSLYVRFALQFGIFFIVLCIYRKWMDGRMFDKKVDGTRKVAIVTGANTGIGKETALGLARHGVQVILACRNMQKAAEARDDIIAATGNPDIRCMQLDLSSFKSIRTFADEFLATGSPLHILINNAGVMGMKRCETKDGLEMQIGVNYFGHFLLTMLLLRRLLESKPSRIINVSSWVHRLVTMRKNDLMGERSYNRFFAYAQSKLAVLYFTKELSKRLTDSGLTCNSLHPGVVFSDLSRNLNKFNWILQKYVFFGLHSNNMLP